MIEDEPEPTDDTEYAREHVDRKAFAEERERIVKHYILMLLLLHFNRQFS